LAANAAVADRPLLPRAHSTTPTPRTSLNRVTALDVSVRSVGPPLPPPFPCVQLVYGGQLQQPADEVPSSDPLDVSRMTRDERDALKRRILDQHPELVEDLRRVD
jgi:hypothetical protein